MAQKHEIEVTIDAQGNVTLEAHGMQGKGCLLALDALSKALGKKTAEDLKPEAYQTATNTVKIGGR